MRQVWHHFLRWEEVKAGMWRKLSKDEEDDYLRRAIEFTGDWKLYGNWMQRVINEWPISCEHNLTDLQQNRKAWLGHAAICLAIGCPEYITRAAWGHLTDEQRNKANAEAQRAIDRWEAMYADKTGEQCLRLF